MSFVETCHLFYYEAFLGLLWWSTRLAISVTVWHVYLLLSPCFSLFCHVVLWNLSLMWSYYLLAYWHVKEIILSIAICHVRYHDAIHFHFSFKLILTNRLMLTINRCDTSRLEGIYCRPFTNSVHGTKHHKWCSPCWTLCSHGWSTS